MNALPVLTYHSIDDSGSPVSIAAAEFRRQMQALAAAGWRTLAMDAFVRGHRDGGWPERTFLLTFDDGYDDVYEYAFRALQQHGMVGTFFVTTDFVERPGYLTWDQIQEMADAYESLESSLDQSAEDLGLTEDVNQALQQAQQAAGGQQEEEAQ